MRMEAATNETGRTNFLLRVYLLYLKLAGPCAARVACFAAQHASSTILHLPHNIHLFFIGILTQCEQYFT